MNVFYSYQAEKTKKDPLSLPVGGEERIASVLPKIQPLTHEEIIMDEYRSLTKKIIQKWQSEKLG